MLSLRSLFLGVAALVPVGGIASAESPAVDAAALFKRSCAMCHGPDGRAATPAAQRLGVKDLSHTERTDDEIRSAIVGGLKGTKTTMPAFGSKFTEAELDALVALVRSLRDSENPAKP
ncbi:MAG: cytochrome c [Opitutaceae bacterium]|nr:cytochrome c [Opitutaceae bacterium]